MKKISLYITLLLGFLGCQTTYANNGQIALTYPLFNSDISIDGNASDWPDTIPSYPIERDFFDNDMPPASDFSAYFKTAYQAQTNSLYVVLVVTDDSHVVNEAQVNEWSNYDSATLYLNAEHSKAGSGSALYASIGQQQFLNANDQSWDPAIRKATLDTVTSAMSRTGTQTIYEWQFKLDQDLSKNRTIGFDFLISDKDADDPEDARNTYFIWGPFRGKSQSPTRIGDLVVISDPTALGTVKGKVAWDETVKTDQTIRRVRLTSLDNPNLWVQTHVDEQGEYEVTLPVGTYSVSSAYTQLGNPWTGLLVIDQNQTQTISVLANTAKQAPMLSMTALPLPDLMHEEGVLFNYTPDRAEELKQVIQGYMAHFSVPGASIALIKDGKVVFYDVFGDKNAYSGEPVKNTTLFEAASITKAVFAFAVNRLAERGEIDLDKPLYEYLPFEDIAHDERYKKITARHALSHQTGFPNWRWQNDDGQLDIKFHPGIKFGYSGEGFEYLGRVVSHITNKSLEQVLFDEVQQPFDYHNTYFKNKPEVSENVSYGHYAGLTAPISTPDDVGVAHSMQTEANTFTQFMLALINREGLSEAGYANMLEPQVAVPVDPDDGDLPWFQSYGLGINLLDTPYGLAYGHGGNNGDFTCDFLIYDDHKMGFAIFTNSDSGTAFAKKMHEYLIMGKDGPKSTLQ